MVVVGGGNAALCAALAARESGASVLLLEKAPLHERGGNSFFTAGGFRFTHAGLEDLRRDVLVDLTDEEAATLDVPPYASEQFLDDLMRLTEGLSEPDLADLLIRQSRPTVVWMRGHGVRWILMLGRQSFQVGGKHRLWGGLNVEAVGGGPGLIQSLYDGAERLGVEVRYGTKATGLLLDSTAGAIRGLACRGRRRVLRGLGPLGGAGVGRLRGEPGVAHAVPRPGLGSRAGPRHPAQHGRRDPHGARRGSPGVRQLVGVPRGRLGRGIPAVRRPPGRRHVPEALVSARRRS